MRATEKIEAVTPFMHIPQQLITSEMEGLYGSEVLAEMSQLIKLYDVYDHGAEFNLDQIKDYVPADLRFKKAANLIDKEARFLFSKTPDIWVNVPYNKESDAQKKTALEQGSILQGFVDNVLKANQFSSKLVQAARDCFIARRVAYFINVNEKTKKITVDFVPSLEFIYEVDQDDITQLSKLVTFYIVKDSRTKADQRIYKKKYWIKKTNESQTCWLNESIYDGVGNLVEEITPDRATKFSRIPGGVIINDGLTGDTAGRSEIELLQDYESWYSRISNADIDAERQGMNPIRWARDMSPESTHGLSIAAGAFWDMTSDPNAPQDVTGEVGVLETTMSYTNAVDSTLARLRSNMLEAIDVPDTSAEALKGVVSSGKTLRAIYWSLIVRCDEKMLRWRPALENIVSLIIEGGTLYPQAASTYLKSGKALPRVEYEVSVDNQYPIPDDEAEEKEIDLQEVQGKTMSRKAYMLKWRGLTDNEANEELNQIARESELLENSFGMPPLDTDTGEGLEEEEEIEDDTLDDEDEEEAGVLAELDELAGLV